MQVVFKDSCCGIAWECVVSILELTGMAFYSPQTHQQAFEASYAKVFVYDEETLIGFGRAISDGVYQAAIYDVAVMPEYQGRGIGLQIIENLLSRLSQCNVILYASPGKEGFYQKLGFRNMKTGMALFAWADAMREKGFTE